ncbi:MAG: phosphoadenosine phosphosulfate reductase family protein, partial [Candidatus Methanomethylophilaceae archaeon]|nr:phosphoadenosine phosphosulfate reductase family protein [Candidatus Methanomethylophilaceae archaeon]
IRDFLARSEKLPLTVSFSGGKDSLAAYALACAAAGKPELIYADTGLEFPETVEYVEKFAAANRCRLHKASGGNGFWDNVGAFGPPAKDFRWCCKVCKLGPVTDLINSDFPGGTVTVEGNRRLESYSRSSIGFVTKNPFVPGQINLNPIRNWRAADVWAYIFACGLDFNPLYKKDFERIGCYLCPASLSSEWQNTRRIHPEMHARWENYLERYASENGLSPEYADLGLWRWKVLPPKMEALSEGLCLTVKKQSAGPSVELLKGASPCAAGGYSMEAIVRMRRNRDFSYVAEALKLYGDVKYSPDYEVALLKTSGGRAKLFGGGQISVTAPDADKAESVFSKALKAAVRAQMCTCCGICAKKCGRNAIKISGGMIVDAKRCVSCGKCEKSCMVMHYYDKLMVQTGGTHACGAPPSAIR